MKFWPQNFEKCGVARSREKYNKVIDLYHIAREENPADLFTKPLPVIKVEKFRTLIGLM